ncbi:MAG TPA: hypothetical protein PLI95_07650 [Polyangiaceae bacterium]|nr:hypothetical protein [Polyangiaceae bacterium]
MPSLKPADLAHLLAVRGDFVSLGHAGGQYTATVRANDKAVRSRAEPGSLWVAEHRRNTDRSPGPVLAMERRGSGWCYAVAASDGAVLRAGTLRDCAGCHAAAPSSESVFTTVGPGTAGASEEQGRD